jgi:glycosyltransferase involved in cell wall biosynthesis
MVIHTPWTRNLGGPRVQLELAEELRALGCQVEKLSYEDVFPRTRPVLPGTAGRIEGMLRTNLSFAARAATFVRAHGRRFDVIDANQTDLPFPKSRLGFSGLLVARSVGLIPAYEEFERQSAERWPEPPSLRRWTHGLLTLPGRRRRARDAERSFRHADLINVSNRDDLAAVSAMGYGAKTVIFPFGLSAARRDAFRQARASAGDRLASRTVAFVGTWNPRKGARDWPGIVARVRVRVPEARFLFLGTGLGRELVLRDFPSQDHPTLEVVPSFDSDELPGLLSRATVGAFPGYLEGFGFSVLEKAAAGLPTVAYDAPGARDTLGPQRIPTMVPVGNTEAFAARIAEILTASPTAWAELSEDSSRIADLLSWPEIARQTLDTYRQVLERTAKP